MTRTPLSLGRLARLLASAGILAAVLLWLSSSGLEPVDLGTGDKLIGRPGVGRFLVGDGQGWRSLSAGPRSPSEGWALPEGLIGLPALASDGSAMALLPTGLVRVGQDGELQNGPDLPADDGGLDWELLGLDGSDLPVLAAQGEGGRRLAVIAGDGEGWLELSDADGFASLPEGAEVLLSKARRALAYRGHDCWEAWVFDDGSVRRVTAADCSGGFGVFSPEGDALILDGPTKGIYRLELDSGRFSFMASGNLGYSERVPFSAGFRGDPLLMVAPVRDNEGYLQLMQTHLRGGGRYGISTGAVHHYHVTSSHDGRYLAYCQATFNEDEATPIDEVLYLFDFDIGRAVYDFERLGGGSLQGPLFVGDGPMMVFVARGRVLLIDPRND